jgi:hypothetical protein
MDGRIIKISEELIKIAEELMKLAPRRPDRYREYEEELERIKRIPPEEAMRRMHVKDKELIIVQSELAKVLEKILADEKAIREELKRLSTQEKELGELIKKCIEENLHIKLKEEKTFDEAIEYLNRVKTERETAEGLIIQAGSMAMRISKSYMFTIGGREKILGLAEDIKEELLRVFSDNLPIIERIMDVILSKIKEATKVTETIRIEINTADKLVKEVETSPEEGRTASLSKDAETILSRVWNFIKGIFKRIVDSLRSLFGIYSDVNDDLTTLNDSLLRIEEVVRKAEEAVV